MRSPPCVKTPKQIPKLPPLNALKIFFPNNVPPVNPTPAPIRVRSSSLACLHV